MKFSIHLAAVTVIAVVAVSTAVYFGPRENPRSGIALVTTNFRTGDVTHQYFPDLFKCMMHISENPGNIYSTRKCEIVP